MASEDEPAEHAYPYWHGPYAAGCAVVFFGLVGSIGVSLLPAGYDRARADDLPTGVAMMVIGVFGIPTLCMAFLSAWAGVRDTVRPPLLRVTAAALVLPPEARGDPPDDEYGEPTSAEPPHPVTVPLAAVRWVRRTGTPFRHVLEVAHDLCPEPLRLAEVMMRPGDFDALELALRKVLPAAFLNAPPAAPTE
jgi:hypothetical protein